MALTKLEKLMFPGFLLAFEVVFLILFGLLVRYDDNGGSVTDGSTTAIVVSMLSNKLIIVPI